MAQSHHSSPLPPPPHRDPLGLRSALAAVEAAQKGGPVCSASPSCSPGVRGLSRLPKSTVGRGVFWGPSQTWQLPDHRLRLPFSGLGFRGVAMDPRPLPPQSDGLIAHNVHACPPTRAMQGPHYEEDLSTSGEQPELIARLSGLDAVEISQLAAYAPLPALLGCGVDPSHRNRHTPDSLCGLPN